jgi:hypothetical protein
LLYGLPPSEQSRSLQQMSLDLRAPDRNFYADGQS